ncbi:MAG: hypothetical protein WC565_01310 [Parcubacteria group bacterium]
MDKITPSVFRAYDIRGIYPKEINEETVRVVVQFLSQSVFSEGKIVVAMDARQSSKKLFRAVKNALKGRELIEVGYATTPMFYYLSNRFSAAGGVMVTASHNDQEWNGLKVVGPRAEAISGDEIEERMKKNEN